MKRIIVSAVTLAVVALVALAVPTFAQGPMGGGMMGGRGGWVPGQAVTSTVPYAAWGGMMGRRDRMTLAPHASACVGGWGSGQAVTSTVPYGAWGGMMGGGMMGGYSSGYAPNAQPIKLDQAVANAQQYVSAFNNSDLKLSEVEEYAWNFYGVVKEKSIGTNAFQILVDKYSGAVYPEMGPNMMWNTKYSPMVGMMDAVPGHAAGKMTVTLDQARANAAQYLKANLPNASVEDKGDTFYGYYNFDLLQNGKTYGMVSVNGYTGAVWFHTWHGDFISARALE